MCGRTRLSSLSARSSRMAGTEFCRKLERGADRSAAVLGQGHQSRLRQYQRGRVRIPMEGPTMRTPITAAFTAAAILLSDSIGTLAADADGQSGLTANTQTIAEFTK